MFGEKFEIYCYEMAENALYTYPPWLENLLKFIVMKWLKMHFSYPPWLEKILKFTVMKWLIMHFSYPTWLKKYLKFTEFI